MRGIVVAMLVLGLAQPALAADLGVLRGSFLPATPYQNWEGFYVGGAVGVGGGGANFNGEGSSLIDGMIANTNLESEGVQNWATAGKADTGHNAQYGGFIGYNAQWGDVVLGLEASYYHTNLSADAGGRTPSDGSFILIPYSSSTSSSIPYAIPSAVSGQSNITLTDFGTIRARAGWAFDRFLPYLTGGVALGRASYGTTAYVYRNKAVCTDTTKCAPDGSDNPWPTNVVGTASNAKTNALIYGWSAGLGMDIALTQNIFIRGEYEYIQFSQMKLNLNNARIAAGVRF